MKKYLILGLIALVFSTILVLAAKPEFQAATIKNPVTGEPKNTVTLPPKAIEVAPNIYYLGTTIDKGRIVEGYAFIDYKKGFGKSGKGKPGTVCGNGICEKGENPKKCPTDCSGGEEPDTSSCYGFLSKDAKWKVTEPYIVDTSNTEGLTDSFIRNNLAYDIAKWESAAEKQILGNEIPGTVDGADTVSTDGKNEVLFGNIEEPGAIAITIVWGYFSGPPKFRELVEWDQVYDQVDFDWSSSGETGKMDFENIAIHELGHSIGLDDLYTAECKEQTMYGYADYGETKKRTLEAGDIAGVKSLYK